MMLNFIRFSFILLCFSLSACTSPQSKLHQKLSKEDPSNTSYQGHYKVGKTYKIKGKTYVPTKNINYDQTGIASWYGSKKSFHGKKTANGDKYNRRLLTAAHPQLPLPSLVKVTNLKNNKSLIVMINDRGPFTKNRILDVSEKAAEVLGFKNQGITKVRIQYLHNETEEFLKNIALTSKEGAKAKSKTKITKCSVNCHVKLVNLKHNIAIP